MPLVLVALFAGPSVAGILTTGLVSGRAGLRELLSRLLRWRVGARWYAAALLTAPFLVTTVLLALSLLSPEFIPGIVTTDNKIALLLFGIGWGLLGGGLLEELGWTGFAVPRLRLRYTAFTTGAHCGPSARHVALPYCFLGGRQFFGRTVDLLLARDPLLLSRSTAGLPGAHGVGLRPHCEPARGDAHARESLSQHADPSASADRGTFLDVEPRIDCHPVGRRCSRRIDQPRTGLATTAPDDVRRERRALDSAPAGKYVGAGDHLGSPRAHFGEGAS